MSYESRMKNKDLDELFKSILVLQNEEECYRFFEDITTVAELQSLAQRLQVAKMLTADETYTKISEETGASTATISRVKRCLFYGADGYKLVLNRMKDAID